MDTRERVHSGAQQPVPSMPGTALVKLPLIDAAHSISEAGLQQHPPPLLPDTPASCAVANASLSPTTSPPLRPSPHVVPVPAEPLAGNSAHHHAGRSGGFARAHRKSSVEARERAAQSSLDLTDISDITTYGAAQQAHAALPHSHAPQSSQPAAVQQPGYASPRQFRNSSYHSFSGAPLSPSSGCTSPQFSSFGGLGGGGSSGGGSSSPGPGGGMEAARLRRKMMKLRAEMTELTARNNTLEAENSSLRLQLRDALRLASGHVAGAGARWDEEDAATAAAAAVAAQSSRHSSRKSSNAASGPAASSPMMAHSYLSRARAHSAHNNVDLDQLLRVVPSPHLHPDVAAALHAGGAGEHTGGVPNLSLATAAEERRSSPYGDGRHGHAAGSSDADADPSALPQLVGAHAAQHHPNNTSHHHAVQRGLLRSPLHRARSHASAGSTQQHAHQSPSMRHSMPVGMPPLMHLHHTAAASSLSASSIHTPALMAGNTSVFPSARSSYSSGVSTSSASSASSQHSIAGSGASPALHPPPALSSSSTGSASSTYGGTGHGSGSGVVLTPVGIPVGAAGGPSYSASPLLSPASPTCGSPIGGGFTNAMARSTYSTHPALSGPTQQPSSPSMQPSSSPASGRFERGGSRHPATNHGNGSSSASAMSPRFASTRVAGGGGNGAAGSSVSGLSLSIDTDSASGAPHRRGALNTQNLHVVASQSTGSFTGTSAVAVSRAGSGTVAPVGSDGVSANSPLSPLTLSPDTRGSGAAYRRSSLTPGGSAATGAAAAPPSGSSASLSSPPLAATSALVSAPGASAVAGFPGLEATAAGNGATMHSWSGAGYPYSHPYPPSATSGLASPYEHHQHQDGEAAALASACGMPSPGLRGRSGSNAEYVLSPHLPSSPGSGGVPLVDAAAGALLRSPRVQRHMSSSSLAGSSSSTAPSPYEQSVSIARRLSCRTSADLDAATSMPMPPLLLSLAASNLQQRQQHQQHQQALHAAGALPSPTHRAQVAPSPSSLPGDSPILSSAVATAGSSSSVAPSPSLTSAHASSVSLSMLDSAPDGITPTHRDQQHASHRSNSSGGNNHIGRSGLRFAQSEVYTPEDTSAAAVAALVQSPRLRALSSIMIPEQVLAVSSAGTATGSSKGHSKRAASEGAKLSGAGAASGSSGGGGRAGLSASPSPSSPSSLLSSASTSRSISAAAYPGGTVASPCHSPPPFPVGEEEQSGDDADRADELEHRNGSLLYPSPPRSVHKRATAGTDLPLSAALAAAAATAASNVGLPTAAVQIEMAEAHNDVA